MRKATAGEYDWSALYQQRPSPAGGGMFKREWFNRVLSVNPGNIIRRCRAWDCAGTIPTPGRDPDYTVGVLLAQLVTGDWLIEDVVRGITSAHGAEYELEYVMGYRPVVNDERATALVREQIGPEELVEIAPIMGGDDFSAYLAEVPGCYAFIGAAPEGEGFPHHHPRFRIDERALATGVRLHTAVAAAALKETR